jgi:hypothetical protein
MNSSIVATALIFLCAYVNFTLQQAVSPLMYVPVNALRKTDICSILSIALPTKPDPYQRKRADHHHSRRTLLHFLLSIQSTPHHQHLEEFIHECSPSFQWSVVEDLYRKLSDIVEPYQDDYGARTYGQYWELKVPNSKSGPTKSRKYIARHRSGGFRPNELKIYWNYDQIQEIRTCSGYNPITDKDARNALLKWPVAKRKHAGQVRFVISGIQNAVFDVPAGKQAIVLDFADERMPGGYYLENAVTQEEVWLRTVVPCAFCL